MGHVRKKKRTNKNTKEEAPKDKTPKSFVLKTGNVGHSVQRLVRDVRKIMEPNTAVKLKERKSNKLKDFVAMSGPLGVSHMMLFSQTDRGTNLRIGRLPRGPTLVFKIKEYTLRKDIAAATKKYKSPGSEFLTAPLLVLNNFSNDNKDMKLMTSMLQSMFPQLNISNMNLKDTRRVVLFNYNSETGLVELRHYLITLKMVGVSKSVKKILSFQNMDLSKFGDISEFIAQEAYASEMSDNEDVVQLAQNYVGRNNSKSEKRGVYLTEIGPRISMELVKIQTGFCGGEVLFHKYVQKSAEEIADQKKKMDIKKKEKEARKKEQMANIVKKKQEQEERRKKRKLENPEAEDSEEEIFEEEDYYESDYNEEDELFDASEGEGDDDASEGEDDESEDDKEDSD
ncbi:Brix domain-containing protein [Rozella allomycis CSF55]|uniref:Brix domain-containing protein n=1 Tax=Rozella allomycis (strain CSF55) TaxID=988480 RepID=A0A075B5E3_ROZAC|nr:Brix domain-containing protein [Rozella allomycis CSF55]|eukprot:EPZ37041.1 Brix domain-containing protein [Rozella allomycis CSF55]